MSGGFGGVGLGSIFGGLAAGGAIAQGEQARKAQSEALKSQERAQNEAKTASIRQLRQNEMQLNKATAKSPDINAILMGEQMRKSGPSSTLLTGASGVDPNSLRLGRTSLLGS